MKPRPFRIEEHRIADFDFDISVAHRIVGAHALAELGKTLAAAKGCVACHTVDGSPLVGPTWKGLYGKTETMADGSTAKVDEAYLRAFIRNPTARVVKGYAPIMPHFDLSEQELTALVTYIESQGGPAASTAANRQP